jgi:hypothetical protein
MSFSVDQLALTADRRAALEAALANSGLPDPLGRILAEAEAEVDRLSAGYQLADDSRLSLVRRLALCQLFTVAELAVPEDIRAAYADAMAELRALAAGQRRNTPPGDPALAGDWGSQPRLSLPRDA